MTFVRALMGMTIAAFAPAGGAEAITFQTMEMYQSQLAAPVFTGVGKLAIQSGAGFAHSCTASLVSSNVILTAAHCLSSNPDLRFVLPSTGAADGSQFVASLRNSYALPSSSGVGTSDMALITLDQEVFGRQIYDLYSDTDELGKEITMVGGGYSGLLEQGVSFTMSDFQLRYGVNRFEADARGFGYNDDIYMFDFDNGRPENDVFGRYLGIKDTGLVVDGKVVDAGVIYGDSGGPDFIGNRLAGVHSFSGSGSFFEPTGGNGCGLPGSVDTVPKGVLNTCSDGSYGDFGGSVRVSSYYGQIRAYIAAAVVPEPGTWAMMILGFALAGGSLRRRRRASMPLPATPAC